MSSIENLLFLAFNARYTINVTRDSNRYKSPIGTCLSVGHLLYQFLIKN